MSSGRHLRRNLVSGAAFAAAMLGIVIGLGGGTAGAAVVESATSDLNSGDYTCSGGAFPGSRVQLRAEFPGDDPDVGETIDYTVLYLADVPPAFSGDWQVELRLPDGSIGSASVAGVGVTVGSTTAIGTVSYTVGAGDAGSTLSAWINSVLVTNTGNNVTVSCTANGSPSQIDLAVPVPPDTEPPDTEPPATEPPDTEPPDTEPPDTEPPDTEPPATEPPGTEPPATEPPDTDPADTDPTDTDPADTDPTGTVDDDTTTTAGSTTGGVTQLPATGPSGTWTTSALLGVLLVATGALALRLARRS